jgi:general secretion pathway protein I
LQAGFTLLEMLVALAVFAIAALTLVRLDAYALRTAGDLEARQAAQRLARNMATMVMTDPASPVLGVVRGDIISAGHQWQWQQAVTRAPDPQFQFVRISVNAKDGSARADLSVVRKTTP